MNKIMLANAVDGVHPNGIITYTAAAAIAKGQVLKHSSGKVTPCTAATDAAIGVALDGAEAGALVPVAILGAYTGTVEVKAAGAIAQGEQIAANMTATAATTDVIIGRALTAASAANEIIEVAHQVGMVK